MSTKLCAVAEIERIPMEGGRAPSATTPVMLNKLKKGLYAMAE